MVDHYYKANLEYGLGGQIDSDNADVVIGASGVLALWIDRECKGIITKVRRLPPLRAARC